jgi:hypothetical protein
MKEDRESKKEIIDYIKTNEPLYTLINLESHSLTQLIILKTEIEIRKNKNHEI